MGSPVRELSPELYRVRYIGFLTWSVLMCIVRVSGINSNATVSSFNFPLSYFPPHVHRPLKTGPWYMGRELCRSDYPFDSLCSRKEWNAIHEKLEERIRDEMAHARLHEAETPSESGLSASFSASPAFSATSRSFKIVKVREKGGSTRIVTLWCKNQRIQEKLSYSSQDGSQKVQEETSIGFERQDIRYRGYCSGHRTI